MKMYYPFIVALVMLVSCGTAKMSISDDLKSSNDEYVVKGKNGTRIKQKMSFGEYATTAIKRSWIKGSSGRTGIGYGGTAQHEWVNIISMEYVKKKQTISFNLSDGNRLSEAYCVSRFNSATLEIGKNPNSLLNISMDIFGIAGESSSNYYVQLFTSGKDDRPWEMLIDNEQSQTRPKKYVGYLGKSPTEYYTIVPVTKMEINGKQGNILAGSVGYEFRNKEGKSVAAVSLFDKGMVFLSKTSPEERFLLANACTALLLQDMIE